MILVYPFSLPLKQGLRTLEKDGAIRFGFGDSAQDKGTDLLCTNRLPNTEMSPPRDIRFRPGPVAGLAAANREGLGLPFGVP